MGLGWQALASSGATPFWQSLYQGNVWDEPLMAFYLTRFQNVSGAAAEEPGGVFTMGMSTVSSPLRIS
jgi:cathepsin D